MNKKPVLENQFEYKGVTCVVLFMPLGYRCGYVGLPFEHKYAGNDYDDIPINCHGGLTYSSGNLIGQIIPRWWIGFDCGHAFDGYDLEKIQEYYGTEPQEYIKSYYEAINQECEIRSLEYCENECKSIVDQILELSNA